MFKFINYRPSVRALLLGSISGPAFLVLSACTPTGNVSTDVTTLNAQVQAGAKAACPGLVAVAPIVNGVGVAIASANGAGALALPAATGASALLSANCAAIEAQAPLAGVSK